MLVILTGTLKLRHGGLSLAAAIGILLPFLFPFLFHASAMTALVLVAGFILLAPRVPSTAFRLLLIGALMILPHHFDRDPGGWHLGLIWLLTLGPTVWLSLDPRAHRVAVAPRRRRV
jgi:hypothetical protein